MAQTDAQRMSRILLAAFLRASQKGSHLSPPDEYRELMDKLDPSTYAVCLAWASEQQQLALEVRGAYSPFGEEA